MSAAHKNASAWPYLLPGVLAAVVFVLLPLVYTVAMGFTNYSSRNLLSQDEARQLLLGESQRVPDSERHFDLVEREGKTWLRVEGEGAAPLGSGPQLELRAEPGLDGEALPLSRQVAALDQLRGLRLRSATGRELRLVSLREFAELKPLYTPDGAGLVDSLTGTHFRPDPAEGFFASETGERLQPGYRVGVGWRHYLRLLTDADFRAPFIAVFGWTVLFAALSVVLTAGLGLVLAVLLNWEDLEGRKVYRLVLFLPYAVPAFISILVFKGLFNQNLGEVNLVLNGLFGIKPAWFSDPWLARLMLVLVNLWLGFPYMTVLCSGLLQSIPADLYEASALAGASPWDNFRRITAPLILKPLTPLLIASFGFNFNNFVLITLLTGGRPDQVDSTLPAGATDILVSYTWRIAFQDSSQQFGLAAAISTLIFLVVAGLTLLQIRLNRGAPS